jgi:hypothetical protein
MKLSGPSQLWIPYATSYNLTLSRKRAVAGGSRGGSLQSQTSKQELRGLARRVPSGCPPRAPKRLGQVGMQWHPHNCKVAL